MILTITHEGSWRAVGSTVTYDFLDIGPYTAEVYLINDNKPFPTWRWIVRKNDQYLASGVVTDYYGALDAAETAIKIDAGV